MGLVSNWFSGSPRGVVDTNRARVRNLPAAEQHARSQVRLARPRIDELAFLGACYGVDRQVAALEIVLERDGRRGIEREARVSGGRLTLGTRKRIFLAGARMQEYGEVLPDPPKPTRFELFGRCADNDPVALLDGQAEQCVTDCAAYLVDFHAGIIRAAHGKVVAMKRIAKAIAACALALAATGCAAPYYWQAIGGQLELLRKREPIEKVIADPATDASLKTTLARVETMRRFAVDELLLPDNDSYTGYVALDRPYVVWNIVATEEFSVDPKLWCFPFAGCVAYRVHRSTSDPEESVR